VPIRCEPSHLELATSFFPCTVTEFSVHYLEIPLSVTALPKITWQHLINDMADKLSTWKGGLMHKSGRMALIKSTLVTMPVHTALSLELPAWVTKAMVKIMHSFLWIGSEMVQGGKYSVAWNMVRWPLYLGGLGVPNLRVMGMSLRLCWLWL
jgi:hypothetical protein